MTDAFTFRGDATHRDQLVEFLAKFVFTRRVEISSGAKRTEDHRPGKIGSQITNWSCVAASLETCAWLLKGKLEPPPFVQEQLYELPEDTWQLANDKKPDEGLATFLAKPIHQSNIFSKFGLALVGSCTCEQLKPDFFSDPKVKRAAIFSARNFPSGKGVADHAVALLGWEEGNNVLTWSADDQGQMHFKTFKWEELVPMQSGVTIVQTT